MPQRMYFGHEFVVHIGWGANVDPQDLELFWFERTNNPILDGVPPNEWVNMYAPDRRTHTFQQWDSRTQNPHHPVTITDRPAISVLATPSRHLEIVALVRHRPTGEVHYTYFEQELVPNGTNQAGSHAYGDGGWHQHVAAPGYGTLPAREYDHRILEQNVTRWSDARDLNVAEQMRVLVLIPLGRAPPACQQCHDTFHGHDPSEL